MAFQARISRRWAKGSLSTDAGAAAACLSTMTRTKTMSHCMGCWPSTTSSSRQYRQWAYTKERGRNMRRREEMVYSCLWSRSVIDGLLVEKLSTFLSLILVHFVPAESAQTALPEALFRPQVGRTAPMWRRPASDCRIRRLCQAYTESQLRGRAEVCFPCPWIPTEALCKV